MANVKWIKITTDIFDDEKILLIESLPEPYAIITVWFKLLCLAGKQNNSGVFMLGKVAYTDKMLATIFRMKEATVTMALQTFEQFGMVEIVDGVITIPNWEKHQSLDKLEIAKEKTRQRVARHREKQKLLAESNTASNVTVTPSNADRIEEDKDIDIDIEIDKDIEKKIKKEKKDNNPSLSLFENIYSEYQLSDSLISKMREWLTYKHERKDDYKEQGLRSLLRQIENKSKVFGDIAVCDLIEECMANNWKGIIFERLKPQSKSTPQVRAKSYDVNSFFEASVVQTWEEKEEPKTAAEDEELQERMIALKERLSE